MKNFKQLLFAAMSAMLLVGCGSKGDSNVNGESQDTSADVVAAEEEEEKEAFGAEMLKKYPISKEMQEKLDALDTNYSKINWDVSYAPFDNDGIIVSETAYEKNTELGVTGHDLVIAYTNLTDESVVLTCNGEIENTDDSPTYNGSIEEETIELWPGCTVAYTVYCETTIPTGNIKWGESSIVPATDNYHPYEITSTISLDDDGETYLIDSTVTSDVDIYYFMNAFAYVVDKDGNVLYSTQSGYEDQRQIPVERLDIDYQECEAVYFIEPVEGNN